MYSHILISTDGSELAQNGVDHGLSLAKALGSKVLIVTVTEPFPATLLARHGGWGAGDHERFNAENREFANSILAAAKASAEKLGLAVETIHVADASPAGAIVDAAGKHGCNLIVMASHGRRGIRRALLGSQTSEVLATASIPVLVVR